MHYYQFNIGDYYSHTHHLDDLEDLAYRKMIDYCYLNECCLPDKVEIIARKIGMRTHNESIANVLQEFFELGEYGYFQPRIMRDIEKYKSKSEKAKASANARWSKKPINPDANALQTECEGNANQEPLTKNQEPVTINQIPYKKIKDSYNEILFDRPKIEIFSDARKRKLKSLWDSNEKFQSLEFWVDIFGYIRESDFLMGKTNNYHGCNFDFILQQSSFIKIYEGFYHQGGNS